MKKAIIFCALLANTAFAEEWWEAPTTTGGKIILTTQVAEWCPKGFYIGYIETSKQDAIYGCWVTSNDRIHLKFGDTVKVYDKEGWTYKTDGKK
jgi:RAB protein geranylgeranyltransferase component A